VVLTQLREFVGPFKTNTIADVYSAIESIRSAKKPDGSPRYKKNTISDFIRFLKRFHLWLADNDYSSIDVKKLNKIHTPGYDTMTKTVEQLLSEEQIKAMIEACRISRDRALIACLYEGGFRVGELGKLTWKQVKFTDWNVVINVNDKTERPRFIPLVMARSYLAQWKNDYPEQITEDGFVFLTPANTNLSSTGAYQNSYRKLPNAPGSPNALPRISSGTPELPTSSNRDVTRVSSKR
jgi:Site-specific recombinase XerD